MFRDEEVRLLYLAYALLHSRRFVAGPTGQELAHRATATAPLACRTVAESSGKSSYSEILRQVAALADANEYTKLPGEFEADLVTRLA